MTLAAAGQTVFMGTTRLRPRHDVPSEPTRRKSYVDERVVILGKQGFDPFMSEGGEFLCSRCVQPIGKDDTAFCAPCHDVLDVILAASRNPTSIPAVS